MSRLPALLCRAFASPLARFFALGGLIFAGFAALDDAPSAPAGDAIVLEVADARRLAARFEATWRRPPTAAELEGLMRDRVLEEAFVREARALGLDRGDAVVRQRLRQKMTFFAESGAEAAAPDEAALRAHMAAHPERFAAPARIAFAQVFLGPAPDQAEVEAARAALAAGADPRTLGAPTLLPGVYADATERGVDGAFGPGFFERLAALETGVWAGPARSAFGLHLVRVSERTPARSPAFEAVRERVEADWRAGRAEAMREAFAEALLARHRIETPAASAVLGE
jgi:parvulin-like peptidyl-prolyl isomerase